MGPSGPLKATRPTDLVASRSRHSAAGSSSTRPPRRLALSWFITSLLFGCQRSPRGGVRPGSSDPRCRFVRLLDYPTDLLRLSAKTRGQCHDASGRRSRPVELDVHADGSAAGDDDGVEIEL